MIIFSTSKEDALKIGSIVERAKAMLRARGQTLDSSSLHMDISACHANGTPLKLDALLAADDFNFSHDVFGISHHMDRDDDSPTGGQCLHCFVPRFAAKAKNTTA